MRHFLSLLSSACLAGFQILTPAASHASTTYTYNLPLTATSGGSFNGELTFSSTTPIPPVGTKNTTQTTIDPTALSIMIDNQTFTLSQDPAATIVFNGTTLYAINFASGVHNSTELESTSNTFVLYYGAGLTSAEYGTYGVPVPSATPEPGSLALLGTGLMGIAGTLYRRRSAGQAS